VQRALLDDVVVTKRTAVLELLAGPDQALLVCRDVRLALDHAFDVLDTLRRPDLERDGLAARRLDKNLHAAAGEHRGRRPALRRGVQAFIELDNRAPTLQKKSKSSTQRMKDKKEVSERNGDKNQTKLRSHRGTHEDAVFVKLGAVLILILGQQGALLALRKKKRRSANKGKLLVLAPTLSLQFFDSLTPGSWPGRRRWCRTDRPPEAWKRVSQF
jgi:hypothetical protein